MEKASLFEHNEIGYKKLCDMLQYTKTATINHATGTGKSFIALKYLYNNRDKKYLYIAPTYPIIEQLMNSCYKIGITPEELNVDTMIYRNLLAENMDSLYQKYDGIIFDEYHRTGAPETYRQIKRLKLNLMEHKDDKKFIGLTATPIRYLDNERNMTEEIFDNNVASTLSLSEAMIQELLPIPKYINSRIACIQEAERTLKRVKKLAPGDERTELYKRTSKVVKKTNNDDIGFNETFKRYINKKEGKYIVFCQNKIKLAEYMGKSNEWFKGFEDIHKYEVHSWQRKEENQKQLDEFNKNNKGFSLLFCVDILNEGVHVDDIDGVILLRRTSSPIIYFQQIGRALSFSGRNKQITIFDMVNNFGNHNAIDAIYNEYEETIRQKIIDNPKNKEKYEELLGRFSIMDETKDIIKELSYINSQVTTEKIIQSKINFAIRELTNYVEAGGKLIFDNEIAKEQYIYISKYPEYVNDEQFQKLVDLKIILPEAINMTMEERKTMLKGYTSFYEKMADSNNVKLKEFFDFIVANERRPDINSKDENEKELAQQFIKILPRMKQKQIPFIAGVLDKYGIKYEPYEKAILDKRITSEDLDKIIKDSSGYGELHIKLPEHYKKAIELITIKYTLKRSDELFEILEKNDEIIKEERAKVEQARFEKLMGIVDVVSANAEIPEKQLMTKLKNDCDYDNLSRGDQSVIKSRYSELKKQQFQGFIKNKESSDVSTFCKKIKNGNAQYLQSFETMLQGDIKLNYTLNSVLEFMITHNGKMPDLNSKDKNEQQLAEKMKQYKENGSIDPRFDNIGEEMGSSLYNPSRILYGIITKNYENAKSKQTVLKCVQFFQKNGRRPLNNSTDDDERKLAIEFQENCVNSMGAEQVSSINRLFNSRNSLKNACSQYIKNMKSKEEREEK